jgi:hypothetical protein
VAFDAQGHLVVAYDVKNVARCYYYDPAHPNDQIYTKVERIWGRCAGLSSRAPERLRWPTGAEIGWPVGQIDYQGNVAAIRTVRSKEAIAAAWAAGRALRLEQAIAKAFGDEK